MVNIDFVAACSLASIWVASSCLALLPKKKIKLSSKSKLPTSEVATHAASQSEVSYLSNQKELKKKFQGEIILEEQFKHQISRASILLSVLSLIMLLARTLQSGFGYIMKDEVFLLVTPPDTFEASTTIINQISQHKRTQDLVIPILQNSLFIGLTVATAFVASTIPLGPKRAYSPNPGLIPAKEVTNMSEDGASIFDRIFFTYCYPIVSKVKKNGKLTLDDVPLLDTSMRTEVLGAEFEGNLRNEKARTQKKQGEKKVQSSPWPVFWALLRANLRTFGLMTISGPFVAASFYAPAFCLNRIVHFLEVNEVSPDPEHQSSFYRLQNGGVYCVLLAFVSLAGGTLQNTFFSYAGELNTRIKVQLNASIFSKTLRKKDISSGASSSAIATEEDQSSVPGQSSNQKKEEDEDSFKSKAQVIQLSSVDANRVSMFSMHYFALVMFPCELLIGGTFIYKILGISALVGIAVSIVTAPLTSWVAKQQGGIQKKLQVARDKRVSVLNEAFGAIRMIKFAAWEQKIQEKVLKLRGTELFYQRLSFVIDVILGGLFIITPNVSILVTFGWFVFIQKETLKPSVAFSAISVLLELRYLLSHVPELVSAIVSCWVSVKRIAIYLGSEEVEAVAAAEGVVTIQSATISWPIEIESSGPSGTSTPLAESFKLRDIDVEFNLMSLNLIAGRTGTGKTLLLLALLHEAEVSAGQIQSPRSPADAIKGDKNEIIPAAEWIRKDLVAYVPQSAFLTNATIRENILFGLPLDEKRYKETIKACQLTADLNILEDHDETEIGEDGIGLSGGQKTRVSIARAFYSRAATLLLDDVLAAVDASTASRLVSDLLSGPLSQGRTIILVSHQVQLCAPIASKVLYLNEEGRVGFDGAANAFLKSELYSGLYQEESTEVRGDVGSSSEGLSTSSSAAGESKPETESKPKKLVKDEKMETGSVKLSVYFAYIREGGWALWICTALVFMVANSWPAITAAWIRDWSLDSVSSPRAHLDLWHFGRLASLYAVEVVLGVVSSLLLYNASLRASSRFFKLVLNSVFSATLRFHDTVSRGRLNNRFSSDFQSLDEELASSLKDLIQCILDLLLHLGVVWYTNGISFIILFAIIFPSYVWVGIGYAAATRDLRRLESATKSPVMGAFSDLISGVTVTRAFGGQMHALSVLTQRTDDNTHVNWFRMMLSRWMSVLFNLSSSFLVLFASLFILTKQGMSAAQAGFALSFLINIFTRVMFATMRFAEVQQRLVSVERIVEFATELDKEPPSILEPRPPSDWPRGEIVAEDLSLRYAPDLPEVLKKVNFKIEKGQKVSLVGSTGSGKTSLATALFRFTDPSNGRILIDGIDITKIGLQDLRSRLQIIPQDPTILSGPLRDSIDVFQEHSDAEVLNALKSVQLIGSSTSPSAAVSIHEGQAPHSEETNRNVFRDLSYPIAEGGSNLSNGQRQLICLARALLNKASIIVFDEATSSIDNETEEILSATIREAFGNATVLTIAHRLRTIANYDLVMVMDRGSIIEMETPKELLGRPESKFYSLCQAAGKAEFEHLKKLAGFINKTSS